MSWRWGVEPTMFLYMMAYMLTYVVEEDLIVYKACTSTHKLSTAICSNISKPNNQRYKEIVQVTVSWYHMWENIASHAIPAVLAMFIGSWSDCVGRKIPLIMGLTGGLIYSSALLAISLMSEWRIEWVLLMGALPCGLTGGPLVVFMAAFSYLADTTHSESRTYRTTLLEVSYLITMPTGVYLGSYLFNGVFNRSHAAMFGLNCACLVGSIIYSVLALERNTAVKSPDKRSQYSVGSPTLQPALINDGEVSNSCTGYKEVIVNVPSVDSRSLDKFWNLFSSIMNFVHGHIVDSSKTLLKRRPHHRRALLYLCLVTLALYTFQREEKHSIYLYTQLRFNWDLAAYSSFRTYQSCLYIIGLLVGVPLFNKVIGMRDTITMIVGALSHIAARICFSVAQSKTLIFVGGGVGMLGPIVAPIIRSSVSKLVPASERGKVFALLSVCDMAVPLVSGALYSIVYSQTIVIFPQAVFILTIVSQIVVLVTVGWMEYYLKGEAISQAKDTEDRLPYVDE